jgi:hypothetical protein
MAVTLFFPAPEFLPSPQSVAAGAAAFIQMHPVPMGVLAVVALRVLAGFP